MIRTTHAIVLALLSAFAQASEHQHHHHNGAHFSQAPAGVMGDHVHGRGDWMFSYSYMRMHMDGLRDGADSVSTARVLDDYMISPLRMNMEMHMLGAMYAASDELTLMLMLPLVAKDMDLETRMGTRFTTRSDGVGDVRFSGVYVLSRRDDGQLLLNIGISAPSGDIDASDDTPATQDARLPYPMQLGSGTWDLLPGLTWTGASGRYGWGGQALATLRLGENDNDYTLGDRAELSVWGTIRVAPRWNLSLRADAQTWGNIDGRDPELNPMMVPTADADLQAGKRLDVLAGANVYLPSGAMGSSRLAFEVGAPAYEDLDGPQMSADWMLHAGWQLVF
jgi:hypothetical protein